MVEYREHLKSSVAVAAGGGQTTIPTGLTALVQNFVGSRNSWINAMVIHEIIIQLPVAYAPTDNIQMHLSIKSESGVKTIYDTGVIWAEDLKAGTVSGANEEGVRHYPIYPNELVSAPNLYFYATSSDTGTVGIDIIYTIRKVSRDAFVNAMLPTNL